MWRVEAGKQDRPSGTYGDSEYLSLLTFVWYINPIPGGGQIIPSKFENIPLGLKDDGLQAKQLW